MVAGKLIPFRVAESQRVALCQERLFRLLDELVPPEHAGMLRKAALDLATETSRDSFVTGCVFHGADPIRAAAFWESARAASVAWPLVNTEAR